MSQGHQNSKKFIQPRLVQSTVYFCLILTSVFFIGEVFGEAGNSKRALASSKIPEINIGVYCEQMAEASKALGVENIKLNDNPESIKSMCQKTELNAQHKLAQMEISDKLITLCSKVTGSLSYDLILYCVETATEEFQKIPAQVELSKVLVPRMIPGFDSETFCRSVNYLTPGKDNKTFIVSCLEAEKRAWHEIKDRLYSKAVLDFCINMSLHLDPGSYGTLAYCLGNISDSDFAQHE
jgi:hypothetical protein